MTAQPLILSPDGSKTPEPAPIARPASAARRLAVRRLSLTDFRNYGRAALSPEGEAVVLTGSNGAGKTNLLEAVSFLIPGRGLRRAKLSEIDRAGAADPATSWAVSADVSGKMDDARIGTGRDPLAEGERRIVRIDGEPARTQQTLADHLTISWLTPAMDRLFVEGASGRRRFLDRLVFAFDPEHAGRVSGYEHAWRERNRLIKDGRRESAWFEALEETLAGTGVAVLAARAGMVARLNRICGRMAEPFPAAALALDGEADRWLENRPALEVEDRIRGSLAATRRAGGEAEGPHRTELSVTHIPKSMPAGLCSTGEQKALLIAIVLAHARLQAVDEGAAPILLLDEVAAHLDERRRAALFEAVLDLGGQAWLTGTDRSVFQPIAHRAHLFDVADGRVVS